MPRPPTPTTTSTASAATTATPAPRRLRPGSAGPVNSRTFGAGDVINLARGSSWTGSGGQGSAALTVNGSGVSGSPITVQPYGSGAAPILRNPSSSYSQAVLVKAPGWSCRVCWCARRMEAGIRIAAGADHVVVQNNEVTARGRACMVQSQYNLITRNNFHDLTMVVQRRRAATTTTGRARWCIKAPNNEVSYNRIVNCKAPSYDYGYDGSAVELFGNVDNSSIHHNYTNNALAFNEIGGGSAQNVKIAYNLIVGSATGRGDPCQRRASPARSTTCSSPTTPSSTPAALDNAFWIGGSLPSASALVMRNNIFYGGYGIDHGSGSAFTHDHNLFYFTTGGSPASAWAAASKQADPQFVNLGGGDYHLQVRPARPSTPGAAAALQHRLRRQGRPPGRRRRTSAPTSTAAPGTPTPSPPPRQPTATPPPPTRRPAPPAR